jgi:hypothetical protein
MKELFTYPHQTSLSPHWFTSSDGSVGIAQARVVRFPSQTVVKRVEVPFKKERVLCDDMINIEGPAEWEVWAFEAAGWRLVGKQQTDRGASFASVNLDGVCSKAMLVRVKHCHWRGSFPRVATLRGIKFFGIEDSEVAGSATLPPGPACMGNPWILHGRIYVQNFGIGPAISTRSYRIGLSQNTVAPFLLAIDGQRRGEFSPNLVARDQGGCIYEALDGFGGDFAKSVLVTNKDNLWQCCLENSALAIAISVKIEVEEDQFVISLRREAKKTVHVCDYADFRIALDATQVATTVSGVVRRTGRVGCLEGTVLMHAPGYGAFSISPSDGGFVKSDGDRELGIRTMDFCLDATPDGLGGWVIPSGVREGSFTIKAGSAPAPQAHLPILQEAMDRGWFSGLAFRPETSRLSNNTVSEHCAFCSHEYAELIAELSNVDALFDPVILLRQSLDLFLSGAGGYGMDDPEKHVDVIPSLLLAAPVAMREMCLEESSLWLARLRPWCERLMAQDSDGDGLIESTRTGVSGRHDQTSSNWWDTIHFGHKDAYANALAYGALVCMYDLFKELDSEFARCLARHAEKIKVSYTSAFLNPETGWLGGWRDVTGQLHDYGFLWVNGYAIRYGLLSSEIAHDAMRKLWATLESRGYSRFDLGLPANLFPIRKVDYHPDCYGSPMKDDGSDTFGIYENGAATAYHAGPVLDALVAVGMHDQAHAVALQMAESYSRNRFHGPMGSGVDWKTWDGAISGYEGLLVDAFTALAAIRRILSK